MSTSTRKAPTPAQIQAWEDWKIRKTFSPLFGALHDLRYTKSPLIPKDFHSAIDTFMRDLASVSNSASRMVKHIYLCQSCRKLATGRKTRSDHKRAKWGKCPCCGSVNSAIRFTRIPTYRDTWITQFHTDHPELLI